MDRFTPHVVATLDGRECLSDSEEWRACCEAVHTLHAVPHADRPAWFASIEKKRGATGRAALEAEMLRVEPGYVLALDGRDVRRWYLDQVEQHRGVRERQRIEQGVVALWEKRKAAAFGPSQEGVE